jgi:ABC-type branched-subunit amino acid transport system substrate-binding protein
VNPISRSRFLRLAGGLAATGLLAACTPDRTLSAARTPAVKTPEPVALSLPGAPRTLTIGLIASLSSPDGEGAQWTPGIGGARVAASRLAGRTTVDVIPVDDHGTRTGAAQAVRTLVQAGVAGIVCATAGDHLAALVDAARHARLPALVVHCADPGMGGDGVWLTGGTTSQADSALVGALRDRSCSRTVLLDAGGGLPDGVGAMAQIRLGATPTAHDITTRMVTLARGAGKPDSVLITGPAGALARALTAVQGARLGLPVFLSSDATAPTFPDALAKAGGSRSGDLTTVGPDAGDDVAMRPGADGQAMTAFLAALRSAAEDQGLTDFFDRRPFSTIASRADAASHDAVMALVRAAATAGSSSASAVRGAMDRLRLTGRDGLAGPDLDLTGPQALGADSIVPLAGSTDDLGLRPGAPAGLSWFRAPSAR